MNDEQLKSAYKTLDRENAIEMDNIRERTIGRETNPHLLRQYNYEVSSLAVKSDIASTDILTWRHYNIG